MGAAVPYERCARPNSRLKLFIQPKDKIVRQKDSTIAIPNRKQDDSGQEISTQGTRPETGRYRLQVDRQTKGYFATLEAAEKSGLVIKQKYPKLHVSIYDGAESTNKTVELPVT